MEYILGNLFLSRTVNRLCWLAMMLNDNCKINYGI